MTGDLVRDGGLTDDGMFVPDDGGLPEPYDPEKHNTGAIPDARPKRSRISRTWRDRIESGVFTKAQCQQWAAAVVPLSKGEHPGGKSTVLTPDEAWELRDLMIARGGVRLTAEHIDQGQRWIARHKAEFPEWVTERFSHFTYDGKATDVQPLNPYRSQYVPVWTIHGLDGQWLRYTATAWQSQAYDGSTPGLLIVDQHVEA